MKELFFNEFGKLRSGWRFGFFVTLFLFLNGLLFTPLVAFLSMLPEGFDSKGLLSMLLGSSIPLFLAILIGWFCGKILEDLPFRALGFWFTKFWFKDFVLGLLIGFASISFAVLFAMLFGNLQLQFNENAGSSAILLTFGVSFLIFIFGAAFEEALFRGYIFQTFTRAKLVFFAIILTSVLFASVHNANPNASYFSWINTFIAGIWMAVAYLKTRTLWFVFALHFSWNWVMGAFFGIEVSGLTEMLSAPLFKEVDSGPAWITGGDYGLEGGIACTIALIASTVLIWFLPILKPTEEMLELTSSEKPLINDSLENA